MDFFYFCKREREIEREREKERDGGRNYKVIYYQLMS